MKNRGASAFLKQIISALKTKTRAIKARLIIFSLLSNRKFLITSISHKLQSVTGHHHHHHHLHLHEKEDEAKATVLDNHNAMAHDFLPDPTHTHFIYNEADEVEDEINEAIKDDNYPDLMHSSEDIMNFEDHGGSVIDMVKNSKDHEGQEFRLEDEIDRVADLFIERFHHQMWMQKQLSFKRQITFYSTRARMFLQYNLMISIS
ncbi:hypothetical protein HS088_TW12G00815 [Tripterygium wilfordii]|uniref:Uncharacterized protein n=1 Tax=Tripterygium wilfordii TaxID=458696 RepID=A0A7J7D0L3_TRIWF|nr:uncharacterized protein LOC120011415 [Tripterygium wilfordii]KAF5739606.1 hypothetical protein HS088_TW12G00815 [Tripterygium wilfordii]